jgi:transposase InsO family protein/predicted aspartyl protease
LIIAPFSRGISIKTTSDIPNETQSERHDRHEGIYTIRTPVLEPLSSIGWGSGALRFVTITQMRKQYLALIDTGAQTEVCGSIVADKLVGESQEGRTVNLRGAFAHSKSVKMWKRCRVFIGQQEFDITFAIIPSLGPMIILGAYFLETHRAVIDLRSNILQLNNNWYSLETSNQTSATTMLYCYVYIISVLSEKDWKILETAIEQATELSSGGRVLLRNLFLKYSEIWNSELLGNTRVVEHEIQLTVQRPLVQRPRRIPLDRQEDIDKELKEMLEKGVIQPSSSPFASEVVLVRKKDGAWRFCIDFRLLNQYTIPDKHPLPRIQDLLRAVRGSRYFAAVDLRAGYWQIPMAKDSIQKTAFRTHRGLFEWVRMPFGLINAPASFQRLMECVLGDLHHSGVLVYIDDVLVHAETETAALELVERVFECLSNAELTIKLEKCNFFIRAIPYLGHILQGGKILPNPDRVFKLREVKRPTNIKQLRSLLGCFGYYRDYIPHYSEWSKPLTDMLRKDHVFSWRQEFEKILDYFISHLTAACLSNPLLSDEFLLETDASEFAVGAILSCRSGEHMPWRPVEFASRTLSDVETRWPAHEREAFAIVFALDRFDHFLRGRHFRVYTDNRSLEFIDKAQKGKLARWASRMAEYTMEIYHKSGAQMEHVDFLSRYIEPEECFIADRMLLFITFPTEEEILKAQAEEGQHIGRGYLTREGITFYRGKIYVPSELRKQVLQAAHQVPPFLHPGTRKTKAIILKLFNWPNLHNDVSIMVKQCLPCQRLRPGIEKLQGLLRQHSPSEVLNRVYMDFWSVNVGQEKHIFLTMLDWSTRWVECVQLKEKSARSVTSAFFRNWICRYGAPSELITDNESSFMSEVFDGICKKIGIRKIRTTLYHPTGNAPIETFHRTLRKGLRVFCLNRQKTLNIDEAVQLICLSYRSTVHLSLGDTPAYRLMGTDPRPPAGNSDWRLTPPSPDQERLRFLALHRLEIFFRAQAAYQLYIERSKNPNAPDRFDVGDIVLTRLTPNELNHYIEYDGTRKLTPTFSAPYRVVRVLRNGQTAILRPLAVRGNLKEAHIRDCRFLPKPEEDTLKIWRDASEQEQCVFEPIIRRTVIDDNFEEVEHPQKRQRM